MEKKTKSWLSEMKFEHKLLSIVSKTESYLVDK